MMKGVGKGSPRGISGYSWRNIFWTIVTFKGCEQHAPTTYYHFPHLSIFPFLIYIYLLGKYPIFPTPHSYPIFSLDTNPSTPPPPHLSIFGHIITNSYLYIFTFFYPAAFSVPPHAPPPRKDLISLEILGCPFIQCGMVDDPEIVVYTTNKSFIWWSPGPLFWSRCWGWIWGWSNHQHFYWTWY